MGWTSQIFNNVQSVTAQFKEIIEDDYRGTGKVLYCHNVGSTYYCAIQYNDQHIGALVVLTFKKGNEFGVKYMSESCLPFYYKANKKLLDMLTPTDDENALTWRSNCRRDIEIEKEKVKPKVGDVIVFTIPLKFNFGSFTTFRKQEKYYSVCNLGYFQLVKIPKRCFDNEYKVVKEVTED